MASFRASCDFSEVEIYREERLGSGAYGVVCRAKCDQLPCAAKLLHPTFSISGNWAVDKFMQECSFLASLKHPHIVQFLGVHTDPSTGQVALILELMDENLTNLLDRHVSMDQLIPFHLLINISHDVTLALQYLHSNAIIHRDLSSNNVLLLGECRAKLTDFGMSKLTTLNSTTPLSSLTQVPGCPVYMPPEAWIYPPVYSEKLDIFSFGVLLLQMITRNQPNPGPMESLISDERSPTGFMKLPVSEIERRSEDIASVKSDHPLKDTILECLIDKPEQRPTAKDLCQKIESLKNTSQYKESSKQKVQQQTLNVSNVPSSTDTGISDSMNLDSLEKKLTDKDLELQKLREKVASLEKENKHLKEQIKDKDEMIQNLKSVKPSFLSPGKHPLDNGLEKIEVDGFSPELLQVLSRDIETAPLNLDYKIDEGKVIYYVGPHVAEKGRHMKLFLQTYEHHFNLGNVKVGFISIPDSLPFEIVSKIISLCNKEHKECSFKYMSSTKTIKLVSKSHDFFTLSLQLVQDLLDFSITLPGNRKLSIRNVNMLDEDVNIYVASAQSDLVIVRGTVCGLSAMNVSSHFQLQKYCEEYTKKNGFLNLTEAAVTPSGGLKAQWVVHTIIPKASYLKHNSLARVHSALHDMLSNILVKAEKLKVQSIAVPPLCFNLHKDEHGVDTAARIMMETFLTYKFSYLKDIRITVLSADTYNGFVDIFIKHGTWWTSKSYAALVSSAADNSKSCRQQ